MTHSPPVPPGNQSPYPLQAAPHVPAAANLPVAQPEAKRPPVDGTTAIVGVVGVVAIGAIAAAVWAFSRKPKPAPKRRKRGTGKATKTAS